MGPMVVLGGGGGAGLVLVCKYSFCAFFQGFCAEIGGLSVFPNLFLLSNFAFQPGCVCCHNSYSRFMGFTRFSLVSSRKQNLPEGHFR